MTYAKDTVTAALLWVLGVYFKLVFSQGSQMK